MKKADTVHAGWTYPITLLDHEGDLQSYNTSVLKETISTLSGDGDGSGA